MQKNISSTNTAPGPCVDNKTFARTSAGRCSVKTDSKLSNLSSNTAAILSAKQKQKKFQWIHTRIVRLKCQ